MLKEERQRQILEHLAQAGKVVATELSETLGTSEDTIRRDLRELSAAGLLQRVHGGALPLRTTTPAAYRLRAQQSLDAKAAIARACLGLLKRGQVIILDGGTTALQVAMQLPSDFSATIVTNSPPVALALTEHQVEVVMAGGRFFKEAQVVVGAAVVDAFRNVRADVCVLGVGSVHPGVGISVLDYEESHVKKAMMAAATDVIVLATADKLSKVAPFVVADLPSIRYLITEKSAGEHLLAPYRDVVDVIAV